MRYEGAYRVVPATIRQTDIRNTKTNRFAAIIRIVCVISMSFLEKKVY